MPIPCYRPSRSGMSEGRCTRVSFGPFRALGGVVGALAGNELVQPVARNVLWVTTAEPTIR